jgi:hypothetical protein
VVASVVGVVVVASVVGVVVVASVVGVVVVVVVVGGRVVVVGGGVVGGGLDGTTGVTDPPPPEPGGRVVVVAPGTVVGGFATGDRPAGGVTDGTAGGNEARGGVTWIPATCGGIDPGGSPRNNGRVVAAAKSAADGGGVEAGAGADVGASPIVVDASRARLVELAAVRSLADNDPPLADTTPRASPTIPITASTSNNTGANPSPLNPFRFSARNAAVFSAVKSPTRWTTSDPGTDSSLAKTVTSLVLSTTRSFGPMLRDRLTAFT